MDEAVDVIVNMQLKFQQFYEFDILVPQIQFIIRVLDISVCHRDRYAQCQTVQGTVNTSQVQFLGGWSRPAPLQRQVPGMVLTVQITVVVPQLQSTDVAVDISVVAQRQLPISLFTAVNMQRQVPTVLGVQTVRKTMEFPQLHAGESSF